MSLDAISPLAKTIPESLFMIYQMTFAIITVALVAGSVADRLRFSAFLLFCTFWLLLVYVPIAHWVWGGGFLGTYGLIDFAGGTVVHLNAGVAGLVAAYVLGARRGYRTDNLAPYDLTLAVIGTGLLWVGLVSASTAAPPSGPTLALQWRSFDASCGKCRRIYLDGAGMVDARQAIRPRNDFGAVAGLGTITPASGFVLPMQAVLIGIIAGSICFWACTWLELKIGDDDSLDVFGVHGIGGFTGTLLAGVFAVGALSASPETPGGVHGLLEGNPQQVVAQLYGIAVTLVWSGAVTFVILKVISAIVPLRVKQEDEVMGLDVTLHGEALQ